MEFGTNFTIVEKQNEPDIDQARHGGDDRDDYAMSRCSSRIDGKNGPASKFIS